MSTAANAWRAIASFLRGFVGMPATGLGASAGNEGDAAAEGCRSPAAAREALAARAAGRRSCC
ncbi:MAG: hypothetical protein ABR538_10895 [Candidatus Binatia bacterium]